MQGRAPSISILDHRSSCWGALPEPSLSVLGALMRSTAAVPAGRAGCPPPSFPPPISTLPPPRLPTPLSTTTSPPTLLCDREWPALRPLLRSMLVGVRTCRRHTMTSGLRGCRRLGPLVALTRRRLDRQVVPVTAGHQRHWAVTVGKRFCLLVVAVGRTARLRSMLYMREEGCRCSLRLRRLR